MDRSNGAFREIDLPIFKGCCILLTCFVGSGSLRTSGGTESVDLYTVACLTGSSSVGSWPPCVGSASSGLPLRPELVVLVNICDPVILCRRRLLRSSFLKGSVHDMKCLAVLNKCVLIPTTKSLMYFYF